MLRGTVARRFFNPLPGVGRLNHVAIAVPKSRDIKEAANVYRNLVGAKISDPVDLPEHGVTTVFVELPNTKLELLHPLGSNSPIAGYLEKNPSGGMHHVCLEVENIEEGMKRARDAKIRTIGDKPKIGAHGKPVVFLHPKDCGGVLVELEQM